MRQVFSMGILWTGAASLISACVSSGPIIAVVPGSESVRVFEASSELNSKCKFVGDYKAQDGHEDTRRHKASNGTLERAEQLLRNEAVTRGANTATYVQLATMWIDPGGPIYGHDFILESKLYYCELSKSAT